MMSHVDESVETYLAGLNMPNSEPTNLTADPRTDRAAALAYASCMAWSCLPPIGPEDVATPSDAEWFTAQVEVLKGLGWSLMKTGGHVTDLVNINGVDREVSFTLLPTVGS